jgi:hypothetical protein
MSQENVEIVRTDVLVLGRGIAYRWRRWIV